MLHRILVQKQKKDKAINRFVKGGIRESITVLVITVLKNIKHGFIKFFNFFVENCYLF